MAARRPPISPLTVAMELLDDWKSKLRQEDWQSSTVEAKRAARARAGKTHYFPDLETNPAQIEAHRAFMADLAKLQ